MRTTQTITISLPPQMVREFEKVRKAESRTRSELVREALRAYFSLRKRIPEVPASQAELAAIRRGREAFARGDYVLLDDLLHALGTGRNQTRRKGYSMASGKGPKSPRSRN